METDTARKTAIEIRELGRSIGRDPKSTRLIVGMLVIVHETDELARAKYEELLSWADLEGSLALFARWTGCDLGPFDDDHNLEFGAPGGITSVVNAWKATIPGSDNIRWTKKRVATELALGGPHPKAIGSPNTVVNELQRWVDETGMDGFNVSHAISPGTFKDFIKWVIPELKKRGVFWNPTEAEGKTMREDYLADGRGPRLRPDHFGPRYKWPLGDSADFKHAENGYATQAPESWSSSLAAEKVSKPQFLTCRNLDDVLGSQAILARAAEAIAKQGQT